MQDKWAGMCLRVSLCDGSIRLWTSVRMVALDDAWENPNRGERLETRRKLRPIACVELLLTFSETMITEEEMKDIMKKLGPRQLGCGTPDSPPGHDLCNDPP